MAEEYFIRGPEDETASGPFSLDALLTLAEAEKISPEHYYYDPKIESWVQFKSNEPLLKQIYPQKRKLALRKREEEASDAVNVEDASPPVKIDEMLAAAEGHTPETRHVRTRRQWQERTAAISVPTLGIMLLISALSVLYPSWNIINGIINETEGSLQLLFQNPVVFLGALDLLMGIFLLLNATEIFPLIRFRAMLGAGFFSIVFAADWINGDPASLWLALASLAFGFGLYICTLTLNFNLMLISAAAGIIGALGIFWFTNLAPVLLAS
ncbi:MAG: hypothetical protein R6V45_13445 [Oceanipulchritudo sp.]